MRDVRAEAVAVVAVDSTKAAMTMTEIVEEKAS
jgi:hypothetical protein